MNELLSVENSGLAHAIAGQRLQRQGKGASFRVALPVCLCADEAIGSGKQKRSDKKRKSETKEKESDGGDDDGVGVCREQQRG